MQEIKSLSRQLNSAYSKSEHGTCLIVRLMSRVTRARSSTIAYLLHEMDGSSDLFKYRCKFTILVLPDVNRVCGNLMDQWLWFFICIEIVVCSLLHSIWCNSCVTQIVSPERYRARIHFGVIEYAAYINMSFIIGACTTHCTWCTCVKRRAYATHWACVCDTVRAWKAVRVQHTESAWNNVRVRVKFEFSFYEYKMFLPNKPFSCITIILQTSS